MTQSPDAPRVRLPVQARGREAWRRILDAGVEVLAETGVARFNVTAVCEVAQVAVTAVYSRVDTRDDLLRAVFDHGVEAAEATEHALADGREGAGAQVALDVLREVFHRHGRFLRPVVIGANDDPYLAARGRENIARGRERFARLAVGADAPPDVRRRCDALFTAVFSVIAFDTAFGSGLVQGDDDRAQQDLHLIAEAILPSASRG